MLMLATACSREERVKNGVATDAGIAAVALPEEQYRDLLKRRFLSTQSGPVTLGILGLDEGCRSLESAVDAVVKRELPKWRANVVTAYRNTVPAGELAEAIEKSPRRARMMLQPHIPAIGAAIKELNSPLLESSAIEVMGSTFAAASTMDQASRPMAERQKDLAQLRETDEICGVKKWPRQ